MTYVIQRTNRPGYVAKPGSRSSYATSLKNASKFTTVEEAKANLCPDNERIVDLEHLLSAERS